MTEFFGLISKMAFSRFNAMSEPNRSCERYIVVSIEIVNANHFVTTGQQALSSVHANEAGATRKKYFHQASPPNKSRV